MTELDIWYEHILLIPCSFSEFISRIKLFEWVKFVFSCQTKQVVWLGKWFTWLAMCVFTFPHRREKKTQRLKSRTLPVPEVTPPWRDGLSWFHGLLPIPFLSLCSGIKECISWESPLLPTVSTYHMASACADRRGLRLVPHLSAPHGSDNVSLKLKPQSVSMRAHAKKAIDELLDDRMNFKIYV